MYGGFVKKILLLLAILPLPFLVACPGKGGSNNSNVVGGISGGRVQIAQGTYAFAGTVTQINPSCGSNVATITVTQGNNGYNTGAAICTATVGAGGIFNCPVPAYGTYYIRASTSVNGQYGGCSVGGQMQALTNGDQGMQICLGGGCTCYTQNCSISKSTTDLSSISTPFPGAGDLKIESSAIYLSSTAATTFDISAEASSGNNLLNTSGSWKGSLASDGTLTIDKETIDNLSYSAQVDASLLQYAQGFCDTSAAAATKSANYARQLGFSDKAAQAVHKSFATVTARVCVYPQGDAEISRVVTLKSVETLNTNRVWFIVVEESQLTASLKTISRPKAEGIALRKKMDSSRKIANDNELLVEEVALGFLIKK